MPAPSALNSEDLARQIISRCLDMGFALAGVARARPTGRPQELVDWLAAGKHGEMTYLAETGSSRGDPETVFAGTRSVIMVADQYASRGSHAEPAAPDAGPPRGRIARYAQGRDYHRVIKKRLHDLSDRLREEHPGAGFRSFVDTAPVLEREHAARAGLGWIGKNTLLIHPRIGSYFLLGGIFTTLDLTPPAEQPLVADACGSCARCIAACPTGAITPYSVDASRCISYLTIEHRSPIPERFHRAVGDWLFGCDVCQEVCPHNSPRANPVERVNPAYEPRNASFDLLDVLGWDESRRRDSFATSALKRVALDIFRRNAVIAAGNALERQDDASLRTELERIAADPGENDIVRVTAASVLARLPVRR